MNNHRDKGIMDFNQSMQFSSTSRPSLQPHNFMSVPTSTRHANHKIEEGRNSSFMNQLEQNMQRFWKERTAEVYDAPTDVRGAHTLPLARIKKVMKSDEQVKMISADTPVVFAKACEMFIMELSIRAWMHTQDNKRRTLQRNDVANAIRHEDLLGFLKDIVPMESYQEDPLYDNDPGVYVPASVQGTPHHPVYPTMNNMQSINQADVAPEGHPASTNHRLAFPVNFGYNMINEFLQ